MVRQNTSRATIISTISKDSWSMIDWPNIILEGREVNIKTAANRLFLIFVSHAGPFLPLRQGMRKKHQ